jgi:hypothetical protein
MSAKDAVIAREQARRRPLPFEQAIHKRKPTVTVTAPAIEKPTKVRRSTQPVEVVEPEPTVDEAETLTSGEDVLA